MTYTLVRAREVLAEALSEIDGLTITAHPPKGGIPKPGTGWIVLDEMRIADYTRFDTSLVIIICLGKDMTSADELTDTYAADVLDTVSKLDGFPYSDLYLTPASLPVTGGGELHGLIVRIATEVETS